MIQKLSVLLFKNNRYVGDMKCRHINPEPCSHMIKHGMKKGKPIFFIEGKVWPEYSQTLSISLILFFQHFFD